MGLCNTHSAAPLWTTASLDYFYLPWGSLDTREPKTEQNSHKLPPRVVWKSYNVYMKSPRIRTILVFPESDSSHVRLDTSIITGQAGTLQTLPCVVHLAMTQTRLKHGFTEAMFLFPLLLVVEVARTGLGGGRKQRFPSVKSRRGNLITSQISRETVLL